MVDDALDVRLYERWLQIAEASADSVALFEPQAGRSWSFAELRDLVGNRPTLEGSHCLARGNVSEFLVQTLVAWRDGIALVPCDGDDVLQPLGVIPAEVCHVKRTSGSTGTPRAVWFTASQLEADVDQIVSTMGLRPEWPNIGVISLAHSYGFSNLVLPLLLHGVPLILASDALPGTLEMLLQRHREVTLPAVPAMWKAWLGCGILRSDRIRLAISAGAPLTLDLERSVFEETGLKIHNFYGSTECGGIAYDRSQRPRTSSSFIGAALDGVALEVVGGRLRVESAAVGKGYADGMTPEILGDGRFLTSDRAEINADGEVFLRGRHGEAINIAGRKVAPRPIEEILGSLAGVRHALVFGVPSRDAERVEELVAVVRLDGEVALDDVVAAAHGKLLAWQRPRHWWDCSALEPDGRGKLSRAAWRRRFLERVLPDGNGWTDE